LEEKKGNLKKFKEILNKAWKLKKEEWKGRSF